MMKEIGKGITVSSGNVSGIARVIDGAVNPNDIKYGDILILPNSNPRYALLIMNATAVICENGGRLSHICIVAMEMGIPCITQVRDIRKNVNEGQLIYVDANKGLIHVEENE